LLNGLKVYENPFRDLFLGYILRIRPDQDKLVLKTPTGVITVEVWCQEDRYTIHEIFAYQIYKVPSCPLKVVDLGANIGVASLYFLSRDRGVRVVAFEPIEETANKLKSNLSQIDKSRWNIEETAVVDGSVRTFQIESTGRYSGIDTVGVERSLKTISLPVALDLARKHLGLVQIVKIDVEGSERFYQSSDFKGTSLDSIQTIFCEGELPSIGDYWPYAIEVG
jgi:FkbM family methyltransferase